MRLFTHEIDRSRDLGAHTLTPFDYMRNSTTVALAPELGSVVASRLQRLTVDVLETLQKDLVRLALLTGAGIAARSLAAMVPDNVLVRVRPEPKILVGLLALAGSVIAALATHLGCPAGLSSVPVCILSPPTTSGIVEVFEEPEPQPLPTAILLVLRYPFGFLAALTGILLIDHTDATVHLLDLVARGWQSLSAFLARRRVRNDARGRHRGGRPARGNAPFMQERKYRPTPLPPDVQRALSRSQRRDLERFRRMAATDPFRALRDCLRVLGPRACRALFL